MRQLNYKSLNFCYSFCAEITSLSTRSKFSQFHFLMLSALMNSKVSNKRTAVSGNFLIHISHRRHGQCDSLEVVVVVFPILSQSCYIYTQYMEFIKHMSSNACRT